MTPFTVVVGGFASEVGKTTLMCDLLRAFRGWEAIKLTRGHYRSCGRDPQACCVAPLLGDRPSIRSGRDHNYASGKDTGRYWEAGASNVHWVIATDSQVGEGIRTALDRVQSQAVLIEGNSLLEGIDADYVVMVASAKAVRIKPSARRALAKTNAIFLPEEADGAEARSRFDTCCADTCGPATRGIPLFGREDLPRLISLLQADFSSRCGVRIGTI